MTESGLYEVVAEYDDEVKALAVLAALRGEGVEAALAAETERLRVLVPPEKEDEALEVLAGFESPLEENWESEAEVAIEGWLCRNCDTLAPTDAATCPACGNLRSEQPAQDGE